MWFIGLSSETPKNGFEPHPAHRAHKVFT